MAHLPLAPSSVMTYLDDPVGKHVFKHADGGGKGTTALGKDEVDRTNVMNASREGGSDGGSCQDRRLHQPTQIVREGHPTCFLNMPRAGSGSV